MITKKEHTQNAHDEKFLKQALFVVEKHLSDNEFSIEDFSREMCMSRAQLHRKLKALTGKSASRYIMSLRLLIASDMIRKQEGNISEIAYSVGFSSAIYFTRCFKKEYGYPPSKLLQD
jgi:AraC-like DNA-binding protein